MDPSRLPLSTEPLQIPRLSRWTIPTLVVGAFIIGYGLMSPLYGLVAFHGDWAKVVKPPVPLHILFICTANVLVMLGATSLTGRLDRKLAGVFTRTLFVHGAVAFIILVTRQWYSIPILLSGIAASSVLGSMFALIRQRNVAPRVGVIGPWRPVLDDAGLDSVQIEDPAGPVNRFDLIVITSTEELAAVWLPTLARALLAGKRVRHFSEFLEETSGAVAIEHFDLDQLPEGGLTSYRTRKRLLDLACVAVLLPLALPLIALAALGILLSMGRPIFFIQPRVGQGGKVFSVIKLRTMRPASPGDGHRATRPHDPRVTPLGQLLRRCRIDELPQLWNVVTGDMSFIGPRPEWTALAEEFSTQEAAYNFRHLVRPGITGWAQVRTGPAADIGETRVKLGYDLFYIKHFSFSLDLQILLRTLWILRVGGGVR